MSQKDNQKTRQNRITEMQNILSELEEEIADFTTQLEKFESKQKDLQKLSQYYGSTEWFNDVQSYNEEALPEGYNYSVLGEDPVFDLIGDNYRIAIKLLEIATEMIKNH